MGHNLDYIFVLRSLRDIGFGVGKKLLIDFVQGNENNDSIQKNKLYERDTFGCLAYSKEEIEDMIEELINHNLIQMVSIKGNQFWKVMELTESGIKEIFEPKLNEKKMSFENADVSTEISKEEKALFEVLKDFIGIYNDEQKKTIISNKEKVLCIAGAGSGKTTVLTKRIEFLVKYRSVNPKKILAITFTRKARQEMIDRMPGLIELGVKVETFNSFCEKILRKYNNLIYSGNVRVITYKDKIIMVRRALDELGINMREAINTYFTYSQQKGKTDEQLANIFMNDCFFIRDYFKFKNHLPRKEDFKSKTISEGKAANLVYEVCNFIEKFMSDNGLRDFADQLIDTINLFTITNELMPVFEHILVDEYQDVNSTQIKLLDLLNPKNLFCVGDPRQSIYGWRGSDIKYILNFKEKFPDCEIINLKKNYRSTKAIVDLINKCISKMNLPDLESCHEGSKDIKLLRFENESSEFEFVIQMILQSKIKRNEIFVLARTNRQLKELSDKFKQRDIKHVVRSDEIKKTVEARENDITLATVHAIKGLEAEMVFLIGANNANFPCKGSEHPVVEMVKVEEYNKLEEERRLFYVAMSRAKSHLFISYTGKKPTNFMSSDMINMIEGGKENSGFKEQSSSNDVTSKLREWRRLKSKDMGVPAFMIINDLTMMDLVNKMPTTRLELNYIKGLGPTKIMRWGDEILDVLQS
ncbi:ATP-dependent DNA helicase UvrD2 [Candidatus Woesearchaeota archaeon]|nr:ATP-dependent DNA helicase UvrD2 [Candidatus Woesearchaeota archaeon]